MRCKVRRRRLLLIVLLLLLTCTLVTTLYSFPKFLSAYAQDPTDYRALWAAHGAPNYQITVSTLALPSPRIAWKLTVRAGQITQQSLLACDAPSADYPASNCATLKQYYMWMGKYTLEQLFELADEALNRTQTSLLKCNLLTAHDFRGFLTPEGLMDAAHTCRDYLQSTDLLAAVEYDPYYGYPHSISSYTPAVMDGFTAINVEDFRIIQS